MSGSLSGISVHVVLSFLALSMCVPRRRGNACPPRHGRLRRKSGEDEKLVSAGGVARGDVLVRPGAAATSRATPPRQTSRAVRPANWGPDPCPPSPDEVDVFPR